MKTFPLAARLVCAAVGVACAWGVTEVESRNSLPAPPKLVEWEADHRDFFALSPSQQALFGTKRGEKRQQDVLWLLVGLAAGGLFTAVAPKALVRSLGGAVSTVIVAGAVSTGAWAIARSVDGQNERSQEGTWSLGDDTLPGFASIHLDHLRSLREQIPEDHAVIAIGIRDVELNLVSWALFPRPIYPIITQPPMGTRIAEMAEGVRESKLGLGHGGRWVLDLERMATFSPHSDDMLKRVD